MFAGDDAALAFTPESYQRLAGVKRRFDPANLFRVNHNITPG
jgi:FAD/FMN-containing dehydrogenase